MIRIRQTYLFLLAFTIFLAAPLSEINGDNRIDIKNAVRVVEAIEGESIVLPCQLTKTIGYNVEWSHNDALIANQSKRIHQIGNDLHIGAVNRQDNGYYNCIATRADGFNRQRRISATIKLETVWLNLAEVTYQPSLIPASKSHQSSYIALRCRVNGNRLHEVRWLKDNQPAELDSTIEIIPKSHRLNIRHPNKKHSGNYKCLARNSIGSVESEPYRIEIYDDNHKSVRSSLICADLNTKFNENKNILLCRRNKNRRSHRKRSASDDSIQHPEALQKPVRKRVNVAEDNSAVLNCDFKHLDRHSPEISIRWKKDSKLIRQSILNDPNDDAASMNLMENPLFRDGRISMNSQNGSLIVASTIPSDGGVYECSVFKGDDNKLSVQSTELNIIEKLKFSPPPPSSKGLEMGTMGKIHCKVQGTPTPQIRWTKDATESLPNTVEDVSGTLIFKNVSEFDRGIYTCHANNTQGQISTTVIVTPVIAPKFIVKPQSQIQVNEMGSLMIHCLATGDPMPKIQWDKDFDYLNISNSDSSRMNILQNGTLYFAEVHLDDEGLYGCTIGSSAGFKREEAQLNVRPSEEASNDDGQEGSFFVVRAVLIVVIVVFSYIILVVGLMFWCRIKRKARKNRMQLIAKDNGDTFAANDTRPNDENEPCLPDVNHKKSENGWSNPNHVLSNNLKDGAQKSDDTAASNNSKLSKKSNLDQISIPRTIFFDIKQLGRGDFGAVMAAKVKLRDLKQFLNKDTVSTLTITNECEKTISSLDNINEIKDDSNNDDNSVRHVLMKALNKVKDENICVEFRRQLDMFRAVSHRNVVKLLGLCRDKDPHYLVLEHTDLGDLKEFLTLHADQLEDLTAKNGVIQKNNANNTISIKLPQLLSFAQQIARGMDAIYRARYIHRDLAARNCVVGSDLTVKVSYPAIIKEKYQRDYFKFKNDLIPLRWLAPECIEEDDNTIKSDVYSFGVLFWELFTFCTQLPFEQVSDEDYLKNLQSNEIERSLPSVIPSEIGSTVSTCWKQNPKERPSFNTINTVISKYLQNQN